MSLKNCPYKKKVYTEIARVLKDIVSLGAASQKHVRNNQICLSNSLLGTKKRKSNLKGGSRQSEKADGRDRIGVQICVIIG